ncbi:MAG TPA: acyltransferase [Dermatophilaceae bacterium]|jgi:peptidoglycan/LPS O-acetylase OafA/YrhL|nr:MAG: Acyltransferase family protein [bacterium ADurb.BinA028]HNV13582.1 acyltransferase [Dermatophilaceae bacterium]HQD61956.1 acyltransferase [Propioniciclava tarda]HOA03989.1 acyltransferase [Dermatophilaceae bacterium]HOF37922.1 acyltransferase [Dermatophilaceae bacterium]
MTDAQPTGPRATRRYAYIDALRGFAALWVFVLHVHGYWLDDVRPPKLSADGLLVRLIGFGGAGVDLFIVLSGFCLTLPLTQAGTTALARIDVRGFFRRRAFRLLPAYYAALAVVVAIELIPAVRPALVPRDLTGVDVLTHLTLTFPLWQSTLAAVNGSLWSIPLEATLYLGFPLLVWLAGRRGIRAVLVMTVAVAALWAVIIGSLSWPLPGGWLPQPDKYLPARWLEFAMGMYAATAVRGIPHPRATTHAVWACALGLPAGLYGYAAGTDLVRTLGFGALGAGLLILLQRVPERHFGAGPLAWLTGLGTISYSFYLLHQPVILLLSGWGHNLGLGLIPLFVVALATSGTLTVAVATAFYRGVERPFLVRGSMSAVVRGTTT